MQDSEHEDRPKTQDELDLLAYRARLAQPARVKIAELQRDERLRHVIFSGQFSVDLLEELCTIADNIRIAL